MSTVFQNIDFQEFSLSLYIFHEANCIPGVSSSGHPANISISKLDNIRLTCNSDIRLFR